LWQEVWWTVRAAQVVLEQSAGRVRTVRISSALLVVLLRFTDYPLEGRKPSAWCCAELLSPLLLDFRFRFGIV
jgi:hypothetical protein